MGNKMEERQTAWGARLNMQPGGQAASGLEFWVWGHSNVPKQVALEDVVRERAFGLKLNCN